MTAEGKQFRLGLVRYGEPTADGAARASEPGSPIVGVRCGLLAVGGAAFPRDVLQASRISQARTGGCGSLTICLNRGLAFQEAVPLLRTELRIFQRLGEPRRIGAGTVRRCRKVLAVRLTARKAIIESGPAFRLGAREAIISSGLALRHLELARRTIRHARGASGLPRCLRHCDTCFAGVGSNRACKDYGANGRLGEQVQSCFHDSLFI